MSLLFNDLLLLLHVYWVVVLVSYILPSYTAVTLVEFRPYTSVTQFVEIRPYYTSVTQVVEIHRFDRI